jgi:hypothetical protein
MVVGRMRIMAIARDTIDAATTTIGKEGPGTIRAFLSLVAPARLGGVGLPAIAKALKIGRALAYRALAA